MSAGSDLWLPNDVNFSLEDSAALDQLLESLAEPSDEPCASCTSGCGCTSDAATHVVSSGGDSGGRFAPFGGESSGWCHPALCEPDEPEAQSMLDPKEQSQGSSTPQQQQPQQQARGHSGSGSGSDEVMWDQAASQTGSPTHSRTSNASATQAHAGTQLRACHDQSSCGASRHAAVSIPLEADAAAGQQLPHSEHVNDKRSSSSCGFPPWSNDCDESGANCSSAPLQSAPTHVMKSGNCASSEGGAKSLLPPGMALAPLQQQSQDLLSRLLQQQENQQQGTKQQYAQQHSQQQQQALRNNSSCSKDHSASQTLRYAASSALPSGVQRVAVDHSVSAAVSSQLPPAPALLPPAECSAQSAAAPQPEGRNVSHESATKCVPRRPDAFAPSMLVTQSLCTPCTSCPPELMVLAVICPRS